PWAGRARDLPRAVSGRADDARHQGVRRDGAEPRRRAAGVARDDGGVGAARRRGRAAAADGRVILKFLLALLVAYLGWRLWHGPARPARRVAANGGGEVAEARALLGVGASAGEAEIRAAHRR